MYTFCSAACVSISCFLGKPFPPHTVVNFSGLSLYSGDFSQCTSAVKTCWYVYVQKILFSKWNTYITLKKHPFTLCLLLPWKRDTPIVSRLLDTDMHPARSLAYKSICITFGESNVWQTQLDPCSLEVIVLFNFLFHFYRRAISKSIACFRLATRVNFTFNRRVLLLLFYSAISNGRSVLNNWLQKGQGRQKNCATFSRSWLKKSLSLFFLLGW